jgi:hypothetical protein
MKRVFLTILICSFLTVLLGMGSQGGTPTDKIPLPTKKFNAIYIDQMDVATECSEISIDGSTFLEGKKGEGVYSISFENIRQVVFRLSEGKLYGLASLRDGSSIELVLNREKKAYGRTRFGTFQIKLNDLKKVILDSAAQKRG